MKINNQIVTEAAEYVSAYFEANLSKDFYYHNFFHTYCIVNKVHQLCSFMSVSKPETRMLIVAAWFHDAGIARQSADHEEAGAELAEIFLQTKDIDTEEIATVKNCILATKDYYQPVSQLEKILCDAATMHLTETNFMDRSKLLRKEKALINSELFTDKEWLQWNLQLLIRHTFQTTYCCEQLEAGKQKNIHKLTQLLEELDKNSKALNEKEQAVVKDQNKKEKKEKLPEPAKAVEAFFRTTSGNHIKLSAMADNKAHILLSINSIIISIILSLLIKNLTEMPFLILPTVLLLCVCLATMVFAVLTTKPKATSGVFTAEQIHNRQANLLFFGNFHKMGWESYEWGMQEIMYDKDYLYKSMTKDIYFLGRVLGKKYRYLNIGYKVFMFGLIASVVCFGLCFCLWHP